MFAQKTFRKDGKFRINMEYIINMEHLEYQHFQRPDQFRKIESIFAGITGLETLIRNGYAPDNVIF